MAKRCLDVVGSALGLMALSPLIALIAVLVRCVDGCPIIFRHLRVGTDRRDFWVYKFRTMRAAPGSGDGSFDLNAIDRVTFVGKLLRKWKLDELPQLWNVLKGDMSLVGPRPEVRRWIEAYPDRWAKVLVVRPGITDPASIEFRNEEAMLAGSVDPETTYRDLILPRKLDLYEEYVRRRTFVGDLKILAKTVWVVLRK